MSTLYLGGEEGTREAREELLRLQRMEAARRAGWTELDLDDLERGRLNVLVHVPTGTRYRPYRGLVDPSYPSPMSAFARITATKGGVMTDVLLLERVA